MHLHVVNSLPGGTKFLVDLRADALEAVRVRKDHKKMNEDEMKQNTEGTGGLV